MILYRFGALERDDLLEIDLLNGYFDSFELMGFWLFSLRLVIEGLFSIFDETLENFDDDFFCEKVLDEENVWTIDLIWFRLWSSFLSVPYKLSKHLFNIFFARAVVYEEWWIYLN